MTFIVLQAGSRPSAWGPFASKELAERFIIAEQERDLADNGDRTQLDLEVVRVTEPAQGRTAPQRK